MISTETTAQINDQLLLSTDDINQPTIASSSSSRRIVSLLTITIAEPNQLGYLIVCLSALGLFFASLITLATVSFNLCPLEPKVPVWLIGFGITGLLFVFALTMGSSLIKRLIVNKYSAFIYLIAISYLILFISLCYHIVIGNIILYSVGSDWDDRHVTSNYYCDPPTYWCMTAIVLFLDVLMPIVISTACWLCYSYVCK
jgi:hypothetical protein